MVAMSTALGATTTTSRPGTAHGRDWKHSLSNSMQSTNNDSAGGAVRGAQNGDSEYDPYNWQEPSIEPVSTLKENANPRTTNAEGKRPKQDAWDDMRNENSKWIHRDKLAKIESEELQAAGIILPKPRATSRPPRREQSRDQLNGKRHMSDASEQQRAPSLPRSRKNSTQASHAPDRSEYAWPSEQTPDSEVPIWDLRLPDEIAEDPGEYWVNPGTITPKSSRIPVAKVSPAPVPMDYIERDAPVQRQASGALPDDDFSIAMPKSRSRSGSSGGLDNRSMTGRRAASTDTSPKKAATAAGGMRKASAPAGTKNGRDQSQNRAKGRTPARKGNNSSGDSTSTRPSTRSGDLSSPRAAPEGEPPWMISAYQPDPRLPPDQQLLPTVARRLQQEKWESEGKFGNIYDKDFRPLTDEGFSKPPELQKPKEGTEQGSEWPLRPEPQTSPTLSRPGTSSYSTMPKIQDQLLSGSKSPGIPPQQLQALEAPEQTPQKDEKRDKKQRGGCGCCVVM